MKKYTIRDKGRTTLRASILLILTILFSNTPIATAQQLTSSLEQKRIAYEQLIDLESSTLLVVLKSDQKKIKALTKIINNNSAKPSQKRKAQKQLKKTLRERTDFHDQLIESFHEIYTFSKFRFMYDHDLANFKNGQTGLFLDRKAQYDQSILIQDKSNIYYAIEGYSSHEGSRVLSYIVHNSQGKALDFPFPSVKLTSVGPALLYRSIFEKSDYRDANVIVERFDYLLKHRLVKLRTALSESDMTE